MAVDVPWLLQQVIFLILLSLCFAGSRKPLPNVVQCHYEYFPSEVEIRISKSVTY